jgi:DNA-binding Lrp family transcriptional regulator
MTELEEEVAAQRGDDEGVEAVILLKVDTESVDDIGTTLATFDQIEHVYLVTGEDDLVLKSTFPEYKELKDFIVKALAPLEGVEDTKTMMIVSTYKEDGVVLED